MPIELLVLGAVVGIGSSFSYPTNPETLEIETASCFKGKANSTIVITLDKTENHFPSSPSRGQKLTSDKVILKKSYFFTILVPAAGIFRQPFFSDFPYY